MRQSGVDNLKQEDEHEGGSLRMQVNSLEPGSYLDKGARDVGPKGIACGVEKSEVTGEAWNVTFFLLITVHITDYHWDRHSYFVIHSHHAQTMTHTPPSDDSILILRLVVLVACDSD
jgi:hypothetical protein